MQSVSFKIWTRVAVSISYDENHYTTGTSYKNWITLYAYIMIYIMSGNQKFHKIRAASFQSVYHLTDAVKAVEGTDCVWS